MGQPQLASEHHAFIPEKDAAGALEAAASGDYSATVFRDDPLADVINRLLDSLRNRAVSSLDNLVETSVSVNETSIQGANLLYGLRRVDDYSQSVAAAAEEMAATVTEISRNGQEIANSARQSKASISDGMTALTLVSQEMQQVATSISSSQDRLASVETLARNITGIAESIKKIAAQTNLLAINAAVEAARAGDAGKGFAVVASEVKALSDRTSAATVEITGIVRSLTASMHDMQEAMKANTVSVDSGRTAVEKLGAAMDVIDVNVARVAQNGSDMSMALQQQNDAASSVAAGITRIAAHSSKATSALESILATADRAQKALTSQLGAFAEIEVPNKLVKLAQSDHVIWKRRLANMMIGREGLRADELSDHHHCRLGKWYDRVQDSRFRSHPAFAALEAPHCRVHQKGIEAVECFNKGDIKGALARVSAVEEASTEVLHLLQQLEID